MSREIRRTNSPPNVTHPGHDDAPKASGAQTESEPAANGWISKPLLPQAPGLLARASDFLDAAVGLDRKGPKPITLTGVSPRDFAQMESKVREMEKSAPPLSHADLKALERGQVLSHVVPRSDGLTEQLTRGIVDLPLGEYLKKIPLENWGANIADHVGGEVKKVGPNEQIERMVLRAPGKDLDMTKVERLYEDRDSTGKLTGAQVRWEVLKTDNGTVLKDLGLLRLEPFPGDPGRTLVTWHNAVEYGQFPFGLLPEKVDQTLLGKMVPSYFKRTIEVQRETVAASGRSKGQVR